MAWLDKKFYHPRKQVNARPEDFDIDYESVTFRTSDDVELHGWWIPASGESRGSVVYCHGNFGNITYHFVNAYWLSRSGFDVLCFDYRGYGRSKGRVTREGTIQDCHAALDYVRQRPDVDERCVLLFGQSLGGAVSLVAAAQRDDLAGVAVDGPFSCYRDEVRWVCRRLWYAKLIASPLAQLGVSRGLDPIDCVEDIAPTPLCLFHGTEDRICPSWMSQQLFDAAGDPKRLWLVPGMDHDQAIHQRADEFRPRLVEFFSDCTAAKRRQVNAPQALSK